MYCYCIFVEYRNNKLIFIK